MKIIKVNPFTILFLLVAFGCGLIKNALIIFLIVLIHEAGHVFFSLLFGYPILAIHLYPFGGITIVNKDLNTPLGKELLLASGGVMMQLGLYLSLFFPFFSLHTKNLIFLYNTTIMLFNLLPIIPLDGSLIVNCLLNKFLSFQKAYRGQIIISLVGLIIFLVYGVQKSLNTFLISTFLIYKTFLAIKDEKFIFNRFLLERFLKNFPFTKISTQKGNLTILKKDTYQYFREDDKIISEKIKLKEKFH